MIFEMVRQIEAGERLNSNSESLQIFSSIHNALELADMRYPIC